MIVIKCECNGELKVIDGDPTCISCGLIPDIEELKWEEVVDA